MMKSMDQVLTFDQSKIEKLEKTLVESILEANKNGKLDYFETKKAAAYILEHINTIQNQTQWLDFLENLSTYWPVFKNLQTMEKVSTNENKEKEIIDKLTKYIKNSKTN